MTIPIFDKKTSQEQPQEMPHDSVPDDFIVMAKVNGETIYAESISVTGPVVRFFSAYSERGACWRTRPNLMCFYTSVVWWNVPQPDWWVNRLKLPVK